MKRIAIVFLLSILLPSALLAVLAVRSLRDQELIVNSQRTLLHQSNCDSLADRINLFMNDVRVFYGSLVDELVEENGDDLMPRFNDILRGKWTQAAAGVVVSGDGTIFAPENEQTPGVAEFLRNHSDFLTSRRVVEVYQSPRLLGAQIEQEIAAPPEKSSALSESDELRTESASPQKFKVGILDRRAGAAAPAQAKESQAMATSEEAARKESVPVSSGKLAKTYPSKTESALRNVMPMQQRSLGGDSVQSDLPLSEDAGSLNRSEVNPESVLLREVTSEESEGAVSRLIDGELHVLLWKRHPSRPELTFWTELDMNEIRPDLARLFPGSTGSRTPDEVSLALLDSTGGLVAQSAREFSTDWTKPFVASEVGPILPRWEVAAYFLDPSDLDASARSIRLAISLITLTLLGAVAAGGYLILRSVNYEMRIASQKTDFVSNVSHELKTPLTSIRMFSELLRDAGNPDPDKTKQYAGVISKESARLTRLINRLLDFSRLDRGEMPLRREKIDLSKLLRETVEDYRPQLEAVGLVVHLDIPDGTAPVITGDRDSLAQVILNLLSNAEKYATKGGFVSAGVRVVSGGKAMIAVTDRGPGISRIHQRRIFEKFYRVDDSITSGIEGSGIGLALSRQIVERHSGSIRHEPTAGGGSTFVIELPCES